MCKKLSYHYDDCLDCDEVYECSDYEEAEKKLSEISECFDYLLKMMYGTIQYDRNNIEFTLGEMADYLKVKLPEQPLAISLNPLHY